MSAIEFVTTNGDRVNVDAAEIEQLAGGMKGSVLKAGDDGYDEARTIWNAMIDRKPALIAMCSNQDDVVRSVQFAAKRNLLVAIHGGGHNIAGNAVCDDGLMINLSGMKEVTVDTAGKRAHVGPGATLGDLDAATQAHGLATPVGINSTTGIAGLTLGGGFGWLSRKYGLTVDALRSADVVTADGKVLTASASENEDLFWALRGGGGNFGVVTRFEFELYDVGPDLLSGLIVYPAAEGKQVLKQYNEFVASSPEDLTVWVVMRQAPPLPFLPEDVHGKDVIVLALLYAGDPADGEKLIEPLHNFGTPVGAHVGVQPFTDWQQAFDPLLTPGVRNYWKTHNFAELNDGAIDVALQYAGKMPSPHCEVFFGALGQAISRSAADATAYSDRDALFVMNVHGRWETAAEDEKCIGWARSLFKDMTPHATGGAYINFMTEDEKDRVANAFGSNHDRLLEIKKKYDPKNFFRMNHNLSV